jgi:hypothetical protein
MQRQCPRRNPHLSKDEGLPERNDPSLWSKFLNFTTAKIPINSLSQLYIDLFVPHITNQISLVLEYFVSPEI